MAATATAPSLHELSGAALALLHADDPTQSANREWTATRAGPDGWKVDVTLIGPDLPATVPQEIATPQQIETERDWRATHRLTVRCPLVVFDISWQVDQPLRILGFSRGDWEHQLMALAP